MKKLPQYYFLLILLVLISGIISRKINVIPLFIGDVLYEVLIYFGFRFLLINSKKSTSLLLSLLFCFSIECLQLLQWHWLVEIRKTTFGHYILGQGFLWTDLFCYIIGTFIAYNIDLQFIKTQSSNL